MSRAVTLANLASGEALTIDETNDRVGIASTTPDATLDIKNTIIMDGDAGVITATSYEGSGANLTGIAATDTIAAASLTVSGITTLGGLFKAVDVNVSGSATVTGQLSVGGTITYEDVTQVDSVGIVTAGLGVRVLSGGIQVVGLTTGLNAAGVSTFATINATSYDEIEFDTWLFG